MDIIQTADLYDEHGEGLQIAAAGLQAYGGKACFYGPMETVRCFEDNTKVAALVNTAGEGRVLVVDGGGSLNCALLGDRLAALALKNGWAGIVVHGAIRDAGIIAGMALGVRALATTPRKSIKEDRGEMGVELGFLGVRFHPGEMLYCDLDGLVLSEKILHA
jgi:regulator of ribonuclease activity A